MLPIKIHTTDFIAENLDQAAQIQTILIDIDNQLDSAASIKDDREKGMLLLPIIRVLAETLGIFGRSQDSIEGANTVLDLLFESEHTDLNIVITKAKDVIWFFNMRLKADMDEVTGTTRDYSGVGS